MRGGFLVTRGAVDLAGEVEAGEGLDLQRQREGARVHVVVLDRVAGLGDDGLFEALDGADVVLLHLGGERGGDAVRVDGRVVEALGLEEDLMALLVGEADDLVLDGGAVARAHALDMAAIHGRAVEVRADDLVGAGVGVGDAAGDLGDDRGVAEEAQHRGVGVALLPLEPVPGDGAAVEARGRAGLEAAHGEREAVEAVGERLGGGLAHAATGAGAVAHMDHAVEEGARGEDHGPGGEAGAVSQGHAGDAAVFDEEVGGLALHQRQVGAGGEFGLHGLAVEAAVGLGAGTLNGGALGAVEEAELDARAVRHAAHDAVEGVHLAHEMALSEATDGGIAGHHAHGGELQRKKGGAGAGAGGRVGSLAAGMAAAHHDDVEIMCAMFHVKHSLADAEAGEDLAEYILHPDAAHKGVELAQGGAEGFGGDLLRGVGLDQGARLVEEGGGGEHGAGVAFTQAHAQA